MRRLHHAGGVSSLGYHIVWFPKYRQRILVGRVATDLARTLRELAEGLRVEIPALEIMWSRSYYIGSVGHVSEATVRRYSESQRTR